MACFCLVESIYGYYKLHRSESDFFQGTVKVKLFIGNNYLFGFWNTAKEDTLQNAVTKAKRAMKTILNTQMKEELIARINQLHEDCVAQWGKMNVYQMVRHCILWEELCQGKTRYKRATLIWRILGKIVFWAMTKDDKPFKTNIQTLDQLKVTEISGDLEGEKNKLITLIHEYKNYPVEGVVQPYFGRVNREKQGQLTYKHIDHHLRQFNC